MADQRRQIASDRDCKPMMIGGNCVTRAIRVDTNYWLDIRYWPNKEYAEYIGYNLNHHRADVSKKDWFIVKITRLNGKIIREQGPIIGSWNNRAELDW